MNFSDALNYLKSGKCITRNSWVSNTTFIYKQIPAMIFGHNIDLLKSMPNDAKNLICKGNNEDKSISFINQICIVKDDKINSWLPTIDDLFAEDWNIIEYNN